MRLLLFILIVLPHTGRLNAQNLVPNPGFELINNCNLGSFDHPIEGFISDWFSCNYQQNSVDVFHSCFNISYFQPPNTIRGYSLPQSGDGMIGLGYIKETNYQEAVSVQLISPLIKDSAYCVSFWVKNSKIQNMQYWVQYVGLLFTLDTVTLFDIYNASPHIKSNIDLSANDWIEVSGYYIASGGEKFVNLGFIGSNISKSQNKPYMPGTDLAPFYFFDNVTVIQCNKDSLLSVVCELPNVLTLNNDNKNELYLIRLNNISKLDVQVMNRWGNVVRTYNGINEVWDGRDNQGDMLTEGVYFVKAIGESNFGDLIQKVQFVHLIKP